MLGEPHLTTMRNLATNERTHMNGLVTGQRGEEGRRYEQMGLSPRSEGREQQVVEQWEGGNYVQSNSHNRHYGSHSYQESSSKNTEL